MFLDLPAIPWAGPLPFMDDVMPLDLEHAQFLGSVHPYDTLGADALAALVATCASDVVADGDTVFAVGDTVDALYVIVDGAVEITDATGVQQ